jgi:hypothetical protein
MHADGLGARGRPSRSFHCAVCFVSGHDLSRAAELETNLGFRVCVRTCRSNSVPTTNQGVPHISLVFREMWETTAADLHPSALQELPIEVRGIPYLAKNERDMGHPLIRGRDRIGPAGSHADSLALIICERGWQD